ncbi:MAG: DUF6876 family protein [Cyanobacteria bacterium P01_D01_bin.56]
MTLKQSDLRQFSGTERYSYMPLAPQFNYTDGVRHVMVHGNAVWLVADIFAFQQEPAIKKYRQQNYFQSWVLETASGQGTRSAVLTCSDGNYNELFRHEYNHTDFPLQKIELWLEHNVLLLPSEH